MGESVPAHHRIPFNGWLKNHYLAGICSRPYDGWIFLRRIDTGRRAVTLGNCTLAEKRMFSSHVQPAVVKIPKKPLEGAALPGEIVGRNKFEDEKLTEG